MSCFDFVAGTGGIGIGRFFILEGNHTLGRSESRLAEFTEYRDYCKLHIILHYVAAFLGDDTPVYAIGRVGADGEGRALKLEMEKAGINVSYVSEDADNPTMYSVCCQYPSGEGFNVTANNSACRTVGTEDVDRFFGERGPGERGIVIAAPEVPLETRLHLLRRGREKQCYNMATAQTGEVLQFVEQGGIALTDLIALNMEEALAFASLSGESAGTEEEKLSRCIHYMKSLNPEIAVVITLGSKGAIAVYRDCEYKREAMDVPVVNTAGAGDCFLGTLAAAKVLGIGLFPQSAGDNRVTCAMDLGIAASGKKVECKDTIDFSISAGGLEKFVRERGLFFSDEVQNAFFNRRQKLPRDDNRCEK